MTVYSVNGSVEVISESDCACDCLFLFIDTIPIVMLLPAQSTGNSSLVSSILVELTLTFQR